MRAKNVLRFSKKNREGCVKVASRLGLSGRRDTSTHHHPSYGNCRRGCPRYSMVSTITRMTQTTTRCHALGLRFQARKRFCKNGASNMAFKLAIVPDKLGCQIMWNERSTRRHGAVVHASRHEPSSSPNTVYQALELEVEAFRNGNR